LNWRSRVWMLEREKPVIVGDAVIKYQTVTRWWERWWRTGEVTKGWEGGRVQERYRWWGDGGRERIWRAAGIWREGRVAELGSCDGKG